MKKLFFYSLGVLLVLVSCAKEQNEEKTTPATNLVPLTFTASGETKTSLNSDKYILWSVDETVSVFSGVSFGTNTEFTVTRAEDEGRTAVFSGLGEVSPEYYALFPYDEDASVTEGTSTINATLPNEQSAVASSFGSTDNLAVARFTGSENLQFKNVGALVGVTVEMENIDCVKLVALGANDQLTGTVHVTMNSDGTINTISKASGEEPSYNYATLTGSIKNGETYYFVVLPGTYASGFQVKMYKGEEYVSFSKTTSQELTRNSILNLGSLSGSNWKTDFKAGDTVKIKNSGSADGEQNLAYVGSDGYWQTVKTGENVHSDIEGYEFNYEIFTRIQKDYKFYFEAEGGEKFTLNSDGNAVERLHKIANAPFKVDKEGIYRIRMVLPQGKAEIKEITAVHVFQNQTTRPTGDSDGNVSMNYYQKGAWYKDNFALKVATGSNDRYKFKFTLKDLKTGADSVWWYGRHSTFGGNPVYVSNTNEYVDVEGQAYFKVQPADDNAWEPGFKFPDGKYQTTENLYYGRLGLDMNNENGVTHYTHTITGIFENTIENGEEVYITGTGVDETENKLKLRYSTSFNNSNVNVNNSGDITGLEGASEYCYEGFCRLKKEGGRIHFVAGKKHYEFTSDTTSVQRLYPGWGGTQFTVKNDGVYRVRVNFNTGTASIDRITTAQYIQVQRHNPNTNDYKDAPELTYQGGGIWNGTIDFGWVTIQDWGDDEKFKFWFRLYYPDKSKYQFLGRYDTDKDGVNIQTLTEDGAWGTWDWYNKLRVTNKEPWNQETYIYSRYETKVNHTATVVLKLNAADGYTYDFTDIASKE